MVEELTQFPQLVQKNWHGLLWRNVGRGLLLIQETKIIFKGVMGGGIACSKEVTPWTCSSCIIEDGTEFPNKTIYSSCR